jgi:outer membrane protein OmpA-like peptidoglycan-associated protein
MNSASTFGEPNGRTRSPARGPHALAPDRFKEKAEREAVRRGAQPKGDAFAGTVGTKAAPVDAFRNTASAKPRAAAMMASAAPVREKAKEKRAALHVVASQPEAEPVRQIEREEARRGKRAARASSMVLVSSSNVVAAAEASAETGGPGELEMPKVERPERKPAQRSGSGGGAGSGAGSGGARPPREGVFNQDDLVAALLVIVMLILLLLYLIRPGGGAEGGADDRLLNTQFAASEPAAPPGPPPDPFGDRPVDLTPKSPLPPTPEAVLAAPAPAAAPAVITMHAWFCTANSDLTPATTAALDKQIADWGPKLTSRELVVTGYADTRGASEYNLALGGARASAVAEYLKSKGVKVAAASGVGELPDLADNQNCSNQRRVDVRLSDMPDETPDRSCAPPKDFAELMCG